LGTMAESGSGMDAREIAELRRSAIELFGDYLEKFQSGAPEAVLPFMSLPVVMVSAGRVAVRETSEQVIAAYGEIHDRLRTLDYGSTRAHVEAVEVLDHETVTVRTLGIRYDRHGRAIEPTQALYLMLGPDGGPLRIATLVAFITE